MVNINLPPTPTPPPPPQTPPPPSMATPHALLPDYDDSADKEWNDENYLVQASALHSGVHQNFICFELFIFIYFVTIIFAII